MLRKLISSFFGGGGGGEECCVFGYIGAKEMLILNQPAQKVVVVV